MTPVAVVSAREAAALDQATSSGGTPSRTLMARAGAAAAAEITTRFSKLLPAGVAVLAGPGNNGGDAWVVARALAAIGIPVRVLQVGEPKTPDAIAERALATGQVATGAPEGESIIVDGLLGTGATGEPRGDVALAIALAEAHRKRGARVVALDVPSGVDATTGEAKGALRADLTLAFGTMKRGLLIAREHAGTIAVLDIGLRPPAPDEKLPRLVDEGFVAAALPPIPRDAHKGTRGKLVIIGGGAGMAGASMLAARAAARSGIGMVRLLVAPANVPVVQTAAYDALAAAWPQSDDALATLVTDWADGLLIGPGLGRTPESRELIERVLTAFRGPIVMDADALNVFEGSTDVLASLLNGRPALLTPHVGEMARLTGTAAQEVLKERYDIGIQLARTLGAAILLKGVPTVVTSPDGDRYVSAAGSPVLATAGSGDLLGGMAATLLTQKMEPALAGACAACVHGVAGELASASGTRGAGLEEIVDSLRYAWSRRLSPPRYPVAVELAPLDPDSWHR